MNSKALGLIAAIFLCQIQTASAGLDKWTVHRYEDPFTDEITGYGAAYSYMDDYYEREISVRCEFRGSEKKLSINLNYGRPFIPERRISYIRTLLKYRFDKERAQDLVADGLIVSERGVLRLGGFSIFNDDQEIVETLPGMAKQIMTSDVLLIRSTVYSSGSDTFVFQFSLLGAKGPVGKVIEECAV